MLSSWPALYNAYATLNRAVCTHRLLRSSCVTRGGQQQCLLLPSPYTTKNAK
jgi:hypothetical protein